MGFFFVAAFAARGFVAGAAGVGSSAGFASVGAAGFASAGAAGVARS